MSRLSSIFFICIMAAVTAPSRAWACATCFGASDSEMAKGMNMGIFSLLIVIVSVLLGVASFFIYLARRASTRASAEPIVQTPLPTTK